MPAFKDKKPRAAIPSTEKIYIVRIKAGFEADAETKGKFIIWTDSGALSLWESQLDSFIQQIKDVDAKEVKIIFKDEGQNGKTKLMPKLFREALAPNGTE